MKKILLCILIGFVGTTAAIGKNLSLGASEAEVARALGNHDARMEFDDQTVLIYPQAVASFTDGHLSSIEFRDLAGEKELHRRQERLEAQRKLEHAEALKEAEQNAERERRESERTLLAQLPQQLERLEESKQALEDEGRLLRLRSLQMQNELQAMQFQNYQRYLHSRMHQEHAPSSKQQHRHGSRAGHEKNDITGGIKISIR